MLRKLFVSVAAFAALFMLAAPQVKGDGYKPKKSYCFPFYTFGKGKIDIDVLCKVDWSKYRSGSSCNIKITFKSKNGVFGYDYCGGKKFLGKVAEYGKVWDIYKIRKCSKEKYGYCVEADFKADAVYKDGKKSFYFDVKGTLYLKPKGYGYYEGYWVAKYELNKPKCKFNKFKYYGYYYDLFDVHFTKYGYFKDQIFNYGKSKTYYDSKKKQYYCYKGWGKFRKKYYFKKEIEIDYKDGGKGEICFKRGKKDKKKKKRRRGGKRGR